MIAQQFWQGDAGCILGYVGWSSGCKEVDVFEVELVIEIVTEVGY